jgi:hypothetical protein
MSEQNVQNHRRLHPAFHFFLVPVSFGSIVVSISALVKDFTWEKAGLALAFVLIFATALIARHYARKNQDRIIRAEVRLRYFILTGKDFTSIERQLSKNQIVALRFAGNEEFISLIGREDIANVSPRDIKASIRNWQADHWRV